MKEQATRLTLEILKSNGYKSQPCGATYMSFYKNGNELWASPAYWYKGEIEVFFGGYGGIRIGTLEELKRCENGDVETYLDGFSRRLKNNEQTSETKEEYDKRAGDNTSEQEG